MCEVERSRPQARSCPGRRASPARSGRQPSTASAAVAGSWSRAARRRRRRLRRARAALAARSGAGTQLRRARAARRRRPAARASSHDELSGRPRWRPLGDRVDESAVGRRPADPPPSSTVRGLVLEPEPGERRPQPSSRPRPRGGRRSPPRRVVHRARLEDERRELDQPPRARSRRRGSRFASSSGVSKPKWAGTRCSSDVAGPRPSSRAGGCGDARRARRRSRRPSRP